MSLTDKFNSLSCKLSDDNGINNALSYTLGLQIWNFLRKVDDYACERDLRKKKKTDLSIS